MLNFEDEVIARFWFHGETHAACTVRTYDAPDVHQAHISWFPADENTLKGQLTIGSRQVRTGRPMESYRADMKAETGVRARHRFASQQAYDEAIRRACDFWESLTYLPTVESKTTELNEEITKVAAAAEDQEDQTAHQRAVSFFLACLLRVQLQAVATGDQPNYGPLAEDNRFREVRGGQIEKDAEEWGQGSALFTHAAHEICVPGLETKPNLMHLHRGVPDFSKEIADHKASAFYARYPMHEPVLFGLNLHALLMHWIDFLQKARAGRRGYQYASTDQNCSGVVLGCLKAAGAGVFSSTATGLLQLGDSVVYVKPAEVRDVVTHLRDELDRMNAIARKFRDSMLESGAYGKTRLDGGTLWSRAEFERQSKSPNFLSLRREQVGILDRVLDRFHRSGRRFTEENFEEKLFCLRTILVFVTDHREKKPQSDRRQGVDALGIQVVKLLELAPWKEQMYATTLVELIHEANRTARRYRESIALVGRK